MTTLNVHTKASSESQAMQQPQKQRLCGFALLDLPFKAAFLQRNLK